ncbi:threonine--tRNA ligase [Caminibacter mediatlanticus]|uniref:Threonine--tRNA ligase n=1 Tax=Caminibacter mediatlanticus TB-2 TaxID=391592 RepID=A0AAI9AEZ7_9BACT|nr:threonine--tRNA ligase [Caminibacter mediatlanticus]EDM22931.1 threonyl-tRNA synthetase [Caminibacter mediatlanticus TB-2]
MNNDIIGYKIGDNIFDLQTIEAKNIDISDAKPIYFDDSEDALEIIRHSAAHLMAQAIKELYPDAKFYVGPTIENGFYYDLKTSTPITDKDLKNIEKKMKQFAKKKIDITRYEISKDEAIEKFKDDELKQEVLKMIPSDVVSIYKQGDFEDLCRGPHLPNTKYLHNVKLQKVAGAYLGGDSNKEMLTRVYGTAFATKEALQEYLKRLEEALKRDHRKLGKELELWLFDEEVAPGMPIWLPRGAMLRANLEKLLFSAHIQREYEPVRGPEILRSEMWKISGHYYNYKENMYFTEIAHDDNQKQAEEYGIKPMNCLSHVKIFGHKVRSYKELPLRFFEFGTVHRHEKSGVLHGLLRVREFTQDDAHIFCRPEQIEEEVIKVLDFVDSIMQRFGFKYEMEISTRPEKSIGSDEIWEKATEALKNALNKLNREYGIDEGGGAFYGPKIDIKITDAIGRKWQCGTIQVDFNLPERFDISYIDENNERKRPVMIHRAIIGSFERFIAILTEHYAGEFPTFIAPIKAIFVPISENHIDYAKEIQKELLKDDLKTEIYASNDSLNKRIRNAEKQKVAYVVIIGDEEVKDGTVAIRDRRKRTQYKMKKGEFVEMIKKLSEVRV